jgi:hypothetical protein
MLLISQSLKNRLISALESGNDVVWTWTCPKARFAHSEALWPTLPELESKWHHLDAPTGLQLNYSLTEVRQLAIVGIGDADDMLVIAPAVTCE